VSFLLGLVVLIASLGNTLPGEAEQTYKHRYEPANTEEMLSKPKAIPVKVGAYIENYHGLSLHDRRFVAEGYYWLEWPQAVEDILLTSEIPPLELFEITNQVDEWDSKIRSITKNSTKLPNGNYYFQVRFSGNFYIPELNLRRSPFASLSLPIILETQVDALALENLNVVLVKDNPRDSLVGSYAEIDGYKLVSTEMLPMVHRYGTSWGLDKGDLSYSAMQVVANLKSSVVASALIWVLPLLIVVGVVLLAPSLAGELGDIRLAIPSTGLLTLIFLQQSYRTALPALDYLTFLDWLYACGYMISIATFVLFVWGTNRYQSAGEGDKQLAIERINRMDTIFQFGAVLAILITAVLAWRA
jgi:hypothetical protein